MVLYSSVFLDKYKRDWAGVSVCGLEVDKKVLKSMFRTPSIGYVWQKLRLYHYDKQKE